MNISWTYRSLGRDQVVDLLMKKGAKPNGNLLDAATEQGKFR